eukprot:489924-Alexandrium_andersonii.AAC.1
MRSRSSFCASVSSATRLARQGMFISRSCDRPLKSICHCHASNGSGCAAAGMLSTSVPVPACPA